MSDILPPPCVPFLQSWKGNPVPGPIIQRDHEPLKVGNCTGHPIWIPGQLYRPPVCGICGIDCIFSGLSLVFVIGIIANFIVILRVIFDKAIRTVTFTAIAGLAFVDMLNLIGNVMVTSETLFVTYVCTPFVLQTDHFRGALSVLWKSATFHVAFLAVVRYIILVHPFRAKTILTHRRILLSLVLLWIIAGIYQAVSMILTNPSSVLNTDNSAHLKYVRRSVNWLMSYLVPLCFTFGLHFMKIVVMRRSVGARNALRTSSDVSPESENSRKRIKEMTRVIAIVLAAEILLPLPRFIMFIMDTWTNVWAQNPDLNLQFAVKGVAQLIHLLTFAINPFIYAFMSPQFRKSCRRMCSRRR